MSICQDPGHSQTESKLNCDKCIAVDLDLQRDSHLED